MKNRAHVLAHGGLQNKGGGPEPLKKGGCILRAYKNGGPGARGSPPQMEGTGTKKKKKGKWEGARKEPMA